MEQRSKEWFAARRSVFCNPAPSDPVRERGRIPPVYPTISARHKIDRFPPAARWYPMHRAAAAAAYLLYPHETAGFDPHKHPGGSRGSFLR